MAATLASTAALCSAMAAKIGSVVTLAASPAQRARDGRHPSSGHGRNARQ